MNQQEQNKKNYTPPEIGWVETEMMHLFQATFSTETDLENWDESDEDLSM